MDSKLLRNDRVVWLLTAALVCAVAVLVWTVYSLRTDLDHLKGSLYASVHPGDGASPYGDTILPDRDKQLLPLPDPEALLGLSRDDAWDPFKEMERMNERMKSIFGDSTGRFHLGQSLSDQEGNEGFNPKIDVKDKKDAFVVEVGVPGLKAGNLDVRVEGQNLTVSGTREVDNEVKDQKGSVIRQEHRAVSFNKTIPLSGPVRPDGIRSTYEDGVLTVRIPKEAAG